MIDSLYTGLIFTTKVCKFSSELMLHSRSKFSTSSNIINTQQIKHPSDILNFTSRRNILFSRIFNSSISLSFNNYNDTFSLHHLSFTPRTKEKKSRFFPRRKEGVEASPRTPLISRKSGSNFSVPTGSAQGRGSRTPPTPTFHHPRPDVLFVARLPQNVTKPRRRICNKLRGCLDNEERVERKTEKGEEVRGRGNV